MKSFTVCLILAAILMRSDTRAVDSKSERRRNAPTDGDTATCDYDRVYKTLTCSYLQASDMGVLEQALKETAQFVLGDFGVTIQDSEGSAIPVDVFRGYKISELELIGNNFPSMPWELLSSVDYPEIITIYIGYNTFDSTNITGTDIFLPFSGTLQSFQMAECNTETIEYPTFQQFSNLKYVYLTDGNITSIGLEYLRMDTVTSLELNDNKISAIETGAFRDMKKLTNLYLSENNLVNLQDGAFDGLDSVTNLLLGNNPFNCTCDLQWLKHWLIDHNLLATNAYCAYPTYGPIVDLNFC